MAGVLRHPRRGFKMDCIYDKTISGICPQHRTRNSAFCFYHAKVVKGLIETDEKMALLELPTIKS